MKTQRYVSFFVMLVCWLAFQTGVAVGDVVLWNKLGSPQEVAKSEVGPGGTIYNGPLTFVPGKFGNGFTSQGSAKGVDFGSWYSINPDFNLSGTIAFWWKPPRDYNENSVYTGGPYSDVGDDMGGAKFNVGKACFGLGDDGAQWLSLGCNP